MIIGIAITAGYVRLRIVRGILCYNIKLRRRYALEARTDFRRSDRFNRRARGSLLFESTEAK